MNKLRIALSIIFLGWVGIMIGSMITIFVILLKILQHGAVLCTEPNLIILYIEIIWAGIGISLTPIFVGMILKQISDI